MSKIQCSFLLLFLSELQKNYSHSSPGKCGSPQWKGDTYCDDDNNNEGCAYDGGDCCGANVKKNFCTECKCLDPSAGGNDGGNDGGNNGGNTDCSKYNNEWHMS